MPTADLVTVGITSYCAQDTIERAISSALGQTWPKLEIIVVDDASDDETVEIVKRLQAAHANMRLVQLEQNCGVALARNQIIAHARGTFVVFFDDDDISLPTRIERQVQRIVQYEKAYADGAHVVCHTARLMRFPDGSQKIARTMGEAQDKLAPFGVPVAERTLLGVSAEGIDGGCATCSQMARRETYTALGAFDPMLRRGEDTDFVIRLALEGGHFVGIGDALVEQDVTPTSDKALQIEKAGMVYILEKHRSFLEGYGEYAFTYRWLNMKYAWLEKRYAAFALALVGILVSQPGKAFRRLRNAVPQFGLNIAHTRFQSQIGAPK